LALYARCVKQILWTYAFIIFPISFFNYYLLHFFNIKSELSLLPSLCVFILVCILTAPYFLHSKTMTIQILAFFVVEDVLQYFLHRALHWGFLYKYIHKVHHHHPAPFGITAAYAHPLEVLILAIPTYGGPLLFTPHLCTMYLWILIRELDSVHTHCGYEFPPQRWLSTLIPYYGGTQPTLSSLSIVAYARDAGTQFHDYHHYAFNVNFASRLTVLDKMFGTYKEVKHVGDMQAEPHDPSSN
jgi:sterol desaturase/sphingolipid hydroxylase (fatty acid hydroxylase superfamily)